MVQGGDPTNSGKGGMSIWGEPFDDEIHDDLKHNGRGVLLWQTRVRTQTSRSFFSPM